MIEQRTAYTDTCARCLRTQADLATLMKTAGVRAVLDRKHQGLMCTSQCATKTPRRCLHPGTNAGRRESAGSPCRNTTSAADSSVCLASFTTADVDALATTLRTSSCRGHTYGHSAVGWPRREKVHHAVTDGNDVRLVNLLRKLHHG